MDSTINDNTTQIYNKLLSTYRQFMELNIFVDSDDEELKNLYREAAFKHNTQYMTSEYPNAGFDLFVPKKLTICSAQAKIDHQIKCSATIAYLDESSGCNIVEGDSIMRGFSKYNTGYYMYPRSSISKTSLRLANSVGIIDSGYRGNLIAMVDYLGTTDYIVDQYNRMFQICSPNLTPIYVTIVEKLEDLGTTTGRGEGGFGSTGK